MSYCPYRVGQKVMSWHDGEELSAEVTEIGTDSEGELRIKIVYSESGQWEFLSGAQMVAYLWPREGELKLERDYSGFLDPEPHQFQKGDFVMHFWRGAEKYLAKIVDIEPGTPTVYIIKYMGAKWANCELERVTAYEAQYVFSAPVDQKDKEEKQSSIKRRKGEKGSSSGELLKKDSPAEKKNCSGMRGGQKEEQEERNGISLIGSADEQRDEQEQKENKAPPTRSAHSPSIAANDEDSSIRSVCKTPASKRKPIDVHESDKSATLPTRKRKAE